MRNLKKLLILIILSLYNLSYATFPSYNKNEKCCKHELEVIWFRFLTYGKDYREILRADIYFSDNLPDKFQGMCIRSYSFKKEYVIINKKLWDGFNHNSRISLIAHEISHLLWSIPHYNGTMTNHKPISIMHSHDFSIDSRAELGYYLLELFNRIKLTLEQK